MNMTRSPVFKAVSSLLIALGLPIILVLLIVSQHLYASAPAMIPVWNALENNETRSIAWGDWDGDGDLDLAVGNLGEPNRVYAADAGSLSLVWTSSLSDNTTSVDWGDWDGDGDLDLAVGNDNGQNRVYVSTGTTLSLAWSAPVVERTRSIDWGDWDGDGDLDLAVGNLNQTNRVYANVGGSLVSAWESSESARTESVAWGDWDGDGDPDLAVGNTNQENQLYVNGGGNLSLSWSSTATNNTMSLAWGDWDNDGDLDLAVGNWRQPVEVYANSGGNLARAWRATEEKNTRSVVWGDWDGDGDLDLAVGNYEHPNQIYYNESGSLALGWSSSEWDQTYSVGWADWNDDGDLDLAVGNGLEANRIYGNDDADLLLAWNSIETDRTQSVAWGDWDNDGDLDLAVGNWPDPNRVYVNENGELSLLWSSAETDPTHSVAWGDWDGDGDLDLAAGNVSAPNRVYTNLNGQLVLAWSAASGEIRDTRSVAWGDWDGDGDLDLAVGNDGQPNQVYVNNGGSLSLGWSSAESENTYGVAWGDWDDDGDLDLATANLTQPVRVYENIGGSLAPAWQSDPPFFFTTSVAWADWDTDGDLDLAVGNHSAANQLYVNDNGALSLGWSSDEPDRTRSLVWGDWDGDGDLDLAVGNEDQPNRVYTNIGEDFSLLWSSREWDGTWSIAWGDQDGDGDLDLAVGNLRQETRTYENRGGSHLLTWSSPMSTTTRSAAWGDWDGDGDLDLAVGNYGRENQVYANQSGTLSLVWTSVEADNTQSVAWGDWDGDGDLDLATGNAYQPDRVYTNVGNTLSLAWNTPSADNTRSVAWGDWNGDGDLDLAAGNDGQPNRVFANTGSTLALAWSSAESDRTQSIAWGDWDGDGDPDLAAGNWDGPNRIYDNVGGTFVTAWSSPENDFTTSVAWGDLDNDGSLDLAVGNASAPNQEREPNRVYRNVGRNLSLTWSSPETDYTMSVAWGDWDGDGDLDLAASSDEEIRLYDNNGGSLVKIWSSAEWDVTRAILWGDRDQDGDLDLLAGNDGQALRLYQTRSANRPQLPSNPTTVHIAPIGPLPYPFLGSATIFKGPTLPINYTLFDAESEPARFVEGYYSLDGGSTWNRAVAASGTVTTDLAASPTGVDHVYTWDIYESGVLGSSDNALFRLDVYNSFEGTGVQQYALQQAKTRPFRIRGSQVRVISNAEPVQDAIVYRRPLDGTDSFHAYHDQFGRPYRSDPAGFLRGRGEIDTGDQLVSLLPITHTVAYTLYHTSASPTEVGLDAYAVTAPGVQTLTVSADNPLLAFNLDVSLEWDASNDPAYLDQLENDLRRASDFLYDLTDGQTALGRVRVFQNRERWNDAHVVVAASNSLRPSAILGGIVNTYTHDIGVSGTITNAYLPGQVRMPPTWNRFGQPSGTIGEDWPRVLAHELGHYLLYLPDNYVGLAENKLLALVDCRGSAMTNPYSDAYSEFLSRGAWEEDASCLNTLAEQYVGRADWETIKTFYPYLNAPTPNATNSGPSTLPLALTQVQFQPVTPTATLVDPFFSVVDAEGVPAPLPAGRSQGYLLKTGESADPADDRLLFLGSAVGDLLQARGAEPGDRLCLFDHSRQPMRIGCHTVQDVAGALVLESVTEWTPEVSVTSVNSRTFEVRVDGISDSIQLQLLPAVGAASEVFTVTPTAGSARQTVSLPTPSFGGHIRLWQPDSSREAIREFLNVGDWPGRAFYWGGRAYGWGGRAFYWGAPTLSGDGQVQIFNLSDVFGEPPTTTLRALLEPPFLPQWLTLVGRAYHVSSTEPLSDNAVLFRYLGRDVPPGHENGLRIYYLPDGGDEWQRLPTELDAYQNHASAAMLPDDGTYALIATVPIPQLVPGWNNFSFPIQESRSVNDALASIDGYYTSVYEYDEDGREWLLHDATVDAPFVTIVNTLEELNFGRAYWLYATEAVTPYLGVEGSGPISNAPRQAGDQLLPATFYGWINPTSDFVPAAGMPVKAEIDGTVCGETTVVEVDGRLAYAVQVSAVAMVEECGATGRIVEFRVGDGLLNGGRSWDNSQAWLHSLGDTGKQLFLPIVVR